MVASANCDGARLIETLPAATSAPEALSPRAVKLHCPGASSISRSEPGAAFISTLAPDGPEPRTWIVPMSIPFGIIVRARAEPPSK